MCALQICSISSADDRPTGLAIHSWLHPGIRVRVVDKHMKGGKYYLKKGYVDDVLTPGIANVAMDDSTEVLEVSENV